jgi:hypothetical protein
MASHGTPNTWHYSLGPPNKIPKRRHVTLYYGGYVKERVYVPPLPADFDELTNRIKSAVNCETEDTLRRVWYELSYQR